MATSCSIPAPALPVSPAKAGDFGRQTRAGTGALTAIAAVGEVGVARLQARLARFARGTVVVLDVGKEVPACPRLGAWPSPFNSRERAGEFGDDLLAVYVPLPKLAFFSQLLPGMLRGEDEYVVIGGLYRVRLARF